MTSFYENILGWYPAEYRETFAREMLATFQEARERSRKHGRMETFLFTVSELAGALAGMTWEWLAKWRDPQRYVISRCAIACATEVPESVEALQNRIGNLIRSMEHAIAHHDFPKARFYSDQERATRALLNRLAGDSGQ